MLSGRGIPPFASATLPPSIETSSPLRRSSFLRGRYCASVALAELGHRDPTPLPISSGGWPIWPSGIVGSISHSDDAAIAFAARQSDCAYLGVDLEPLSAVDQASEIATLVADAAELDVLAGLPRAQAVLTAFCAKEALYKALFPGRFLDFDAARVRRYEPDVVELELACAWTPSFGTGAVVPVRIAVTDHHIIALAIG